MQLNLHIDLGPRCLRCLRCLLYELAQRDVTKLAAKTPAGKMLAEHLSDLARREAAGPSVLLAQTDLWLEQMAEHFPGTEPASYVSQARRVMNAVFNTTDSASGTRHLIE